MKRLLPVSVLLSILLASCNSLQKDLAAFSVIVTAETSLDSTHVSEGAILLFVAKTRANSGSEAADLQWYAFLRIGSDSVDISIRSLNELQNDSIWFTVPDSGGHLVTVRCVANWPDGSGAGEVTFPLYRYRPAVHPSYLGQYSTCNACHAPYIRAWSQTRHAVTGQYRQTQPSWVAACNECHTTGYTPTVANGGFDERPVNAYDHVRCEACHGPSEYYGENGAAHVAANRFRGALINPDSSCLQCHIDRHQPISTQWRQSRHANSMDHNEFASLPVSERDRCAACHIAIAGVRIIEGDSISHWPATNDDILGIGCVVCHDPHATRFAQPNGKSLRKPVTLLCATCHRLGIDNTPSLDNYPHHPQSDLLTNRLDAIFQYEGSSYPTQGSHQNSNGSCIYCHVSGTGSLTGQTMTSGHSFTANVATCQVCHTGAGVDYITLQQAPVLSMFTRLGNGLEQSIRNGDSTSTAFKQAKWTYEFIKRDGSMGIHNRALTLAMLDAVPEIYLP